MKQNEKWLIKINYSWGDKENDIEKNGSFEQVWQEAKKMAIDEAETSSMEQDCEIGISFDKGNNKGCITLRYEHDNSYCKYDVVKQE